MFLKDSAKFYPNNHLRVVAMDKVTSSLYSSHFLLDQFFCYDPVINIRNPKLISWD